MKKESIIFAYEKKESIIFPTIFSYQTNIFKIRLNIKAMRFSSHGSTTLDSSNQDENVVELLT